ncbi:regulatory protein, luxR family [Geodermatophilus ruber]|uniref:Regulatory protein, luxR family n=1 Tax=Geodermatophilus ruber TaxID=504800 RepID=A0A1I4FHM0_9ACTN|nr:regulatory protein, luxR family [Geodermatophilus ruber]
MSVDTDRAHSPDPPADLGRPAAGLLTSGPVAGPSVRDAAGRVPWSDRSEAILEGVRIVSTGGGPIDPHVTPSVLAALRDRGRGEQLSDREREVLELLRQGHSNKVIARRLRITEGTVKTHANHILHRVGALDRTQAGLWAERHLRPGRPQEGRR